MAQRRCSHSKFKARAAEIAVLRNRKEISEIRPIGPTDLHRPNVSSASFVGNCVEPASLLQSSGDRVDWLCDYVGVDSGAPRVIISPSFAGSTRGIHDQQAAQNIDQRAPRDVLLDLADSASREEAAAALGELIVARMTMVLPEYVASVQPPLPLHY